MNQMYHVKVKYTIVVLIGTVTKEISDMREKYKTNEYKKSHASFTKTRTNTRTEASLGYNNINLLCTFHNQHLFSILQKQHLSNYI